MTERRRRAAQAIESKAARIQRLFKANPMFAIPHETKLDLRIEPHQSLEKLRLGLADRVDIETLGSRVNLCRLGCERFRASGSYPEAVECAERAVVAVTSVRDRAKKRGLIVATGDELRAISEAVCLADDIDAQSSRLEIKRDLEFLLAAASHKGGADEPVEVMA